MIVKQTSRQTDMQKDRQADAQIVRETDGNKKYNKTDRQRDEKAH